MLEKPTLKFLFVLAILLLFAYLVYPTYRFNTLSEEKKQRMKVENPDAYEDLLEKSIKLGLDLQGGMNLVMEVDVQSLLDKLAKNKDERFQNALQAAAERAENEDVNVIDAFEEEIRQRGADIALYYGTRERRSRQEIINYLHEQEEESIDRTLEILRNRVDQFGVSEPNIQKQGNKRIIIELAGITDRQRALELVGKTAKLEFRLLEEQEVTQRVASRINEYLTGGLEEEEDTVETEEAPQDTTEAPQDTAVATPEELFGEGEEFDTTEFDTTGLAEGEAEAEQGKELFYIAPRNIVIKENNVLRFHKVVQDSVVQNIIQQEAGDAQFLLGKMDPRME
ncbi:MAG: hypothetical protein GWN16_14575, partial [Calditrichae bacterium]|nr:hypothetical protein [Calditrichia bacterium]